MRLRDKPPAVQVKASSRDVRAAYRHDFFPPLERGGIGDQLLLDER